MAINQLYPEGRPSISANFARTKQIPPNLQYSRASTGTYVGPDGLIKTALVGEPRFDYDLLTGDVKGLLVEEARTNRVRYSEDFANPAWVKGNATVTANQTVAPDGTLTGSLLYPTATSTSTFIYNGWVLNGYATMSVYAKSAGKSFLVLWRPDFVSGNAWFNLSAGTVSSVSLGTASIVPVGNGWYRCTYVSTVQVVNNNMIISVADANGSLAVTTSGTNGIYIWGAQAESSPSTGSFPTSYIPTVASAVTRAADTFSPIILPSSNSSTILVETESTINATPILSLNDGTTTNEIKLISHPIAGGASVITSNDEICTSIGGSRLYKSNTTVSISPENIEIITEGNLPETINFSSIVNNVTTLMIGRDASNNYFNGSIKSLYYYPQKFNSLIIKSLSNKKETESLPSSNEPNIVFTISITQPNTIWNFRARGNINCTVRWGDGENTDIISSGGFNHATTIPHTYIKEGIYRVVVKLNTTVGLRLGYFSFSIDAQKITSILFTGEGWRWDNINAFSYRDFQGATNLVNIKPFSTTNLTFLGGGSSGQGMFRDCTSLLYFPFIDATPFVDVAGAWANCSSLTSFPLLDFSNVTSFGSGNQGAWQGCSGLKSFPLINTSKATQMFRTWFGCSSLTQFPFIDTSNCINFVDTWNNCSGLTSFPQLDFSKATGSLGGGSSGQGTWRNLNKITSFPFINISGINGSVAGAWGSCSSLTEFPLLDFSKVTSFGEQNQGAWLSCSSLTNFPSIVTSSGINFIRAWQSCSNLSEFPLLDFSNAVNISYAWLSCSSLTSFPIINTPKVTNINGTWQSCTQLTQFPLINTSAVTIAAGGNDGAWKGCTGLTSFPLLNLSNCSIFGDTTLGGTWRSCINLTSFPKIIFSSGTNFSHCWAGCSSLANFDSNCFDNTPGTNFTNAFLSCALTAQSIENILVSINTAGTSNGTLGISGGTNATKTTWTTEANTAYDALIARGWTITFNA